MAGTAAGAAGIADEVPFATKNEHFRQMVQRVIDAGVPFAWVTADEAYGQVKHTRSWLEQRRITHVMATKVNDTVITTRWGKERVDHLIAALPRQRWKRLSGGQGAHGERIYDWARTMREIVNALLYQSRTGCQWAYLPHDLPPKSATYYYFAAWRDDGTDQVIHELLRCQVRERARRLEDPTLVVLDTQASSRRRRAASLRTWSTSLREATVTSQPRGLSGTPASGHCRAAANSASRTASSHALLIDLPIRQSLQGSQPRSPLRRFAWSMASPSSAWLGVRVRLQRSSNGGSWWL